MSTYPKIIDFAVFTKGSVELPRMFGVHIGWIFALIIAVIRLLLFDEDKARIRDFRRRRLAEYGTIRRHEYALDSDSHTPHFGSTLRIAGYLQVAGANHTLTETTAGGVDLPRLRRMAGEA